MYKYELVKHILSNNNINEHYFGDEIYANNVEKLSKSVAEAFAPANLALCKYWGKRNEELNLPVTSSLSISLGQRGTCTSIQHNFDVTCTKDIYIVNNVEMSANTSFTQRLKQYLDLFRPHKKVYYVVKTRNTIPTSSGFASSASGFSALILALNRLYNWNLPKKDLSILARLGSGSACRSLWNGFVEWQKGVEQNGMDSHGYSLPYVLPNLRIGALIFTQKAKEISSREAMHNTMLTSPLYDSWVKQVDEDLLTLHQALKNQNFSLLGKTAESNSLLMHAIMQGSRPAIIYTQDETLNAMRRVWRLRDAGIEVYFTQDAGANLQLLFLEQDTKIIQYAFPEMEIIVPFPDIDNKKIVLVDEKDNEIGVDDKLLVHKQGKLHRAFSIVVWRKNPIKNDIEILLQQRSFQKYHSAGLWANTCCGHQLPEKTLVQSAEQRLEEEMGFTLPLKEKAVFTYKVKLDVLCDEDLWEHEIDHVFVAKMPDSNDENIIIQPNSDEVQDYKWQSLDDLIDDVKVHPEIYSAWLPLVLKHLQF